MSELIWNMLGVAVLASVIVFLLSAILAPGWI